MKHERLTGYAFALFTIIVWGSTFISSKILLTTYTPAQIMLTRFLLAYAAFIALGMPDSLLGIAWPTMRADFGVPLDMLGTLLIGSVSGYTWEEAFAKLENRLGKGKVEEYPDIEPKQAVGR